MEPKKATVGCIVLHTASRLLLYKLSDWINKIFTPWKHLFWSNFDIYQKTQSNKRLSMYPFPWCFFCGLLLIFISLNNTKNYLRNIYIVEARLCHSFSMWCQVSRVGILRVREVLRLFGSDRCHPKGTCPELPVCGSLLEHQQCPPVRAGLWEVTDAGLIGRRGEAGQAGRRRCSSLTADCRQHCWVGVCGLPRQPQHLVPPVQDLGKHCMFDWINIHKLIKTLFLSLFFIQLQLHFLPIPPPHPSQSHSIYFLKILSLYPRSMTTK